MNHSHQVNPEAEDDVRKLRQAIAEARALLGNAAEQLRAILGEEIFRVETPVEVEAVMESAAGAIDAALRRLDVDWSSLPWEARFWDWKLGPAKPHYL